MIKVFLKNSKTITFELGDEKKEIDLVTRFHNGLYGNTVLNLKTSGKGIPSRIKVSDIKNMQCLKARTDKSINDMDSANSPQDSKFKTREEYEKWKEQKMRENKLK